MIDLWIEIYATIKRNKMRTALTGFAVAWGIFMLIVLMGAGNGLLNALNRQSEGMAMNSMMAWPGWTSEPWRGLKAGREVKFTQKELEATSRLEDMVDQVTAVQEQSGVTLSYNQDHVSIQLEGHYPKYLDMTNAALKKGRFINAIDIRERRKVIVLHEKTAEMLFGSGMEAQAIGKMVNASGLCYRVVGIYSREGEQQPPAYLPYTTLQLVYNKEDKMSSMAFTTKGVVNEANADEFEERFRRTIAATQQFDPDDRRAVWVWNRIKQYTQQQGAQSILRTAIWVIGIFTLLSGIVGVSNIMLITVRERTREFGIRKALGAKPFSILWLIIVESVTITTLFGYIGMVAGIGVTEWMNISMGEAVVDIGIAKQTVFVNPTVDLRIAIQATVTLIIAGTLAGLFPARKAVLIRPIEALRN
ncbi:ABC transporter permease [Bacteroides sp.]|uniref:ABC transporter permease n=1 Tax=Bacteroides sp. TaxID=29523 RepID=UPI0023CD9BEE|nr:ABC transporter permease [Bacteroides sp.]MDE5709811.1 ABC transporter permease [Bacteroides sp.]MDE6215978.1 ABC transporter permease [Bacteroides sp.]